MKLQSQVRVLQAEVQALSHQVNGLEGLPLQVDTLKNQQADAAQHAKDYSDCMFAFTRDNNDALYKLIAIQGRLLGLNVPTDLSRWNDNGACARVGITR